MTISLITGLLCKILVCGLCCKPQDLDNGSGRFGWGDRLRQLAWLFVSCDVSFRRQILAAAVLKSGNAGNRNSLAVV